MSLQELDRKLVWHPFTHQKNAEDNLLIARAEGAWLYDGEGKKYLDAISSWWVNLHGHAHPAIADAIYAQAKKLEHIIFAGFTHEPAVQLAEKLIKLLPGNYAKIFYSDNGSTATEVALKMAIQYWWNKGIKKKKILAFRNSYHGDTFGAMSVSDRGVFTLAFHDLFFEVVYLDTPTPENIADLKDIVHREANDLACFIYEPLVQGAGGMRVYDADLMNELLETIKLHNIICIADEVMTGFGRTGKIFASAFMNEKPDILCLSKGITGGSMAMGVTACTEKIYEAYLEDDKMKTFFHGHSYTANPIACAAAIASLELLKNEQCVSAIEKISTCNKGFAETLKSSNLPIRNIRSLGTILAFELDSGRDEYLNTSGAVVGKAAMLLGLYIRPLGNTVYIMPPYCVDEKDLNFIYDNLLEIISSQIPTLP